MIQKIKTFTNVGLHGYEIVIEADMNRSLPTIEIIGLPDTAIKEAKERIRGSFRHTGIQIPANKIVLNLAPSDIRKEGTRFDLPMAVAMMCLCHPHETADNDIIQSSLFFGELGLDGHVKRIDGLLPSVLSAVRQGYTTFFVPHDNIYELEYIDNITVYPIAHFRQIVEFFVSHLPLEPLGQPKDPENLYTLTHEHAVDFAHIKGHLLAKRALAVAAAGLHNVLLIGSPGSGKTMLAKALQGILPPLSFDEILEVSQIYSLVGKLDKHQPMIVNRPFRQVHHTASRISIVGGGRALTPGEVTLAHKGILFFDELPEFPRETLEVLRQPLEDKTISISRVTGTIQYPANVMFVSTMNPSPCGYFNDPEHPCTCSIMEVKRYQGKISGPLLDRIDLILEIPREKIESILDAGQGESSSQIRERVMRAWGRQQRRFAGTSIVANAHMSTRELEQYVILDEPSKAFLTKAVHSLNLSPRVVHRTMRLARTIADMEDVDDIAVKHIAESLQYRNKNMFV